MFLIRSAEPKDLDDLHSLAKQTFFINLPPDREIIADKIDQSQRSFSSLTKRAKRQISHEHVRKGRGNSHTSGLRSLTGRSDLFMVVLENIDTGSVVGTSQVIASMGGTGHPRYFMTLSRVSNSSKSLGLGWTHLVATLGKDETGPSEIGGLILNHAFRGHPARLGRLLSFARFHLMGLFAQRFSDHVVAEMLGPITRTGYNPFYEKFTRHFITRAFNDIYRFSQTSREFVETLIPPGDIFLSILDPEVANAAGEVSEDTRPARRLLERLGFQYYNRIDPLDGGPHLEAKTRDIALITATERAKGLGTLPRRGKAQPFLVSSLSESGHYRLIEAPAAADKAGKLLISAEASESLAAHEAEVLGYTPPVQDVP